MSAAPKITGDELFVPASHVLVTDRCVSHTAFRLWCVLHRLWFLREAPTMDLLQELMGTWKSDADMGAAAGERLWQPATRRSIERWLRELEVAGWLVWTRREDASRRYHLRTSARSATDTALLTTTLRTLINSGKATLTDVQMLLHAAAQSVSSAAETCADAATLPSHSLAMAAEAGIAVPHPATPASHDTTAPSHHGGVAPPPTIPRSHATTQASDDPISGSHHTNAGSHGAICMANEAIRESHQPAGERVLTPQITHAYKETLLQNQKEEETPPSPDAPSAGANGGGEGPTATERFLLRESFSARAAREFRAVPLHAIQADVERRKAYGQGPGAMVVAWRIDLPVAPSAPGVAPDVAASAADAKAQALALAPPEATALDIQYLAFDLEEGATLEVALANLAARRPLPAASQREEHTNAYR